MGYTTIIYDFSTMHTNLSSKKCLIIYTEVPIELMGTTQKKRTRYFDPVTDTTPKKQKGGNTQGTSNPNTWHPLLKSKLTFSIEVSGKPSLSAVLKYCGKTANGVYPLIDQKCAPNDLYGKCYLGEKFPRDHSILNAS